MCTNQDVVHTGYTVGCDISSLHCLNANYCYCLSCAVVAVAFIKSEKQKHVLNVFMQQLKNTKLALN